MRCSLREAAMQTCRLQGAFWDRLNQSLEELDALEEYQIDLFIRDYFSDNTDALSALSKMKMIMISLEEGYESPVCLNRGEDDKI